MDYNQYLFFLYFLLSSLSSIDRDEIRRALGPGEESLQLGTMAGLGEKDEWQLASVDSNSKVSPVRWPRSTDRKNIVKRLLRPQWAFNRPTLPGQDLHFLLQQLIFYQ